MGIGFVIENGFDVVFWLVRDGDVKNWVAGFGINHGVSDAVAEDDHFFKLSAVVAMISLCFFLLSKSSIRYMGFRMKSLYDLAVDIVLL